MTPPRCMEGRAWRVNKSTKEHHSDDKNFPNSFSQNTSSLSSTSRPAHSWERLVHKGGSTSTWGCHVIQPVSGESSSRVSSGRRSGEALFWSRHHKRGMGEDDTFVTSRATSSSCPLSPATRSFSSSDVLDFGMHKGKSYDEVVEKHPSYVTWLENFGPRTPAIDHFLAYTAARSKKKKDATRDPHTTPTPPIASDERPHHENVQAASAHNQNEHKVAKDADDGNRDHERGLDDVVQKEGTDGPLEENRRNRTYRRRIIQGTQFVRFGRYREHTFEEVFDKDPTYCCWVVGLICREDEDISYSVLEFAVYCQQRWLETKVEDAPMNIEAPKRCLTGQKFCLVGRGSRDLPARRVRECLQFFGATIGTRASSKCAALLVLSPTSDAGHPVEVTTVYMDAIEKGVEILPIEDFLYNRLHQPGNNTSTFV